MPNKTYDKVQLRVKFTQASNRANIGNSDTNGENIAISFGKLSKWYEALVPTGGSSGKILAWNTAGTAKWSDPLHPSITKSADTTSTPPALTNGGTFNAIDSVTRDSNGHVTKINTVTYTLPSYDDVDTKVTQSSSTTSDFRPLLLGKNNQTNPENLETTVTDQTYVTKHVFVQPSTGNLTLYNASGDSPSLIFRRGTMIDNTLEWRIQNVGGKLNFDRDKNESTETWENILQLDPTNNKLYFKNTEVSLSGHMHSQYLPKTTYEWNKEISFGNSGYLKIGSFPMYDTNITIDINATTSKTYHGTVVIATQNVSTTSMGTHKIHVYDDPTGNIAASLRIVWTSGSRNYDIYFVPQSWSKNFIHIRALGNYMDGATDICVSQTGTAPATTSGLEPVNILSVTSTGNGNAVTKVEIDSVGNLAVTKGTTFLTSHQTVTDKNVTLVWGTQKTVATIGSTDIHVTLPGNPNTDRYVNTASFADDSTNTAASPVKMTLTRAGSDTATVTANIPKVSSTSAGVAPKGSAVSSQSQSTKFLREDGSWAAPSYTSIPSNNVTGSGTSGYLTKWNGTHTITNGPQLGSSTTTYLNNAGNWATPPDTKNTAGSTDTSSKIFLIGATSQATNPQTYSDNEVYTTSGVLTTKKVQVGGGHCTMEYNSTTETLDFVFA